jgi:phosphorylcholine metabolism protein LicD
VSSHSTAKQLADENKKLYEYILNNADELKRENEGKKSALIRNLEDVVITNREKSLFIPKSVRKKFLDNGSIYYLQLDNIKCRYMGDNVSKPETAEEFEIPVAVDISDDKLTDVEEKNVVNMQQIHDELFGMLKDVKKVFDEGGVQFMLDGGTLIGSIRDNGKFLPWDDDVDISIRTEDVERAKKLVREKLGEKYVVQDCETEKYYSPRLSSFRIRQKNEVSLTDEKDSVLYERYDGRGLFLDVYAYCPVLVGRNVDWCYRKLFIHPLHRHIKRIEDKSRYKAKGNERFSEHYLAKFEKLKKKYVSRIEWYLKHVNCRDYYCYEPRYLDNLKHPGPYIPAADLYGTSGKEKQSGNLEGESFGVPAIPENVLRAFYGENWNRSPYCSVEELKQKGEPKTYNILITKHIDYMYKRWLVYPNVKKLEKLQARRRYKNRYDIYDKKIARLEKKIKSRNDWYLAHAHCRKYVAYQPAMLNKNRLKIYIKRAEFEKTDGSKYNFDIHMYTKSAFDATLYKHLKRASIGGKEYVADK